MEENIKEWLMNFSFFACLTFHLGVTRHVLRVGERKVKRTKCDKRRQCVGGRDLYTNMQIDIVSAWNFPTT